MFHKRRNAALKVAQSLFTAEQAIDAALARVAELNATLVTARSEADLSAVVGQDAFEVAASTYASLARARTDIVETHKRLDQTKTGIGLRTVATGDQGKEEPMAQRGADLKVVA